VLAGIHRGGRVFRVKEGRTLDQDGVELLGKELAVTIKASEAIGFGDSEFLSGAVNTILKIVGDGDHIVASGIDEHGGKALSTATAANEAYINFGVSLGSPDQLGGDDGKGERAGTRAGEESAPANVVAACGEDLIGRLIRILWFHGLERGVFV
jgi:hypothetical protein